MKGKTGIERAEELGELMPAKQSVTRVLNRYNAGSARLQAYTENLKALHRNLAASNGIDNVIYSYTHTFNGFSAKMSRTGSG